MGLRITALALVLSVMHAGPAIAQRLPDPPLPLPRLPISGDQDGSESPLTMRSPDFEAIPQVQLFRAPGTGPVTLRFDFVFREASFGNELCVFRVDDPSGAVDGLQPGTPGYLAAALKRTTIVFPSGSTANTPDASVPVNGGDLLVFFLVQGDTLANLRARNPGNARDGQPVAFFSLDPLNPDQADHFVGFENRVRRYTQFGFEDLTGGGDRDFDDVVYNVDPPLGVLERTSGRLRVVATRPQAPQERRTIEIVLDASGSMNRPLGSATRWATALDVFRQVVADLPDDASVGLRAYGHRYSSTSPATCTDTELLLPVTKLDRGRLLTTIQKMRPRGQTPLVHSALQTIADLRSAGGGTVILITDGEESCKGNVQAAIEAIRKSGIDLTLHIVGFTVQGQATERDLRSFAEGTGGRYFRANDGEALGRALRAAATDKLSFVVRDSMGRTVTTGEAGGAPIDLPAGSYDVVVSAVDQELSSRVTIQAGADARVEVVWRDDRFSIEP